MRMLRILFLVLAINTVFATIVMLIDESHFKGLDRSAPHWQLWLDCYYFGISTVTTVGYGDIIPASFFARMLVMGYMFVVLFNVVS